MRHFLPCLLPLIFAAPVLAQDYGAPGYALERWDEDYSYLANPKARTDLFDPIKYVPFGTAPDQYLSFGGEFRERFDYFHNAAFGGGVQDENGFFLSRFLLNADAHFGPNVRAFAQMVAANVNDRAGGARYADADYADLQQAFVDLSFPFSHDRTATLRIGRQELIYGAQRLISPNDWANVRRTFDGARVSFSSPTTVTDVFFTRPVIIEEIPVNSSDNHQWFAGIYHVTALPAVLPRGDTKLDLYLLDLESARSATYPQPSEVYTLGGRVHSTPAPWDFDVEADYQFGDTANHPISAWSLAAEGGYTFGNCRWKPRASAGLDIASGSANPGHRFNQLFPPQYLYLGHAYLFGRQNLVDAHAALDLNVTRSVNLDVAQHVYWRQNTHDALYNLTGGVTRAGSSGASFAGTEFDAVLNWQVQRHLDAYLGYAHFFTGAFIDDTGPHRDLDFLYAAVTFTF